MDNSNCCVLYKRQIVSLLRKWQLTKIIRNSKTRWKADCPTALLVRKLVAIIVSDARKMLGFPT
jgi:hypothetical protein